MGATEFRIVKNSAGWWWITGLTEEQEEKRLSRERELALSVSMTQAVEIRVPALLPVPLSAAVVVLLFIVLTSRSCHMQRRLTRDQLKDLMLSNPAVFDYFYQMRQHKQETERAREQAKLINEQAEAYAVIEEAQIPRSEKIKLRQLVGSKSLSDMVTLIEAVEASVSALHRDSIIKQQRPPPKPHPRVPTYDLYKVYPAAGREMRWKH